MFTEILLTILLIWSARYIIVTHLERRKMPPGPIPYPFLGNIPQMMSDPINPFRTIVEKYGDIFTVKFPIGNAVVLNSASLVREARIERKDDIAGRLPEFMYPFDKLTDRGVFSIDYSPVFLFRKKVFLSALHIFGSGIEQVSERSRNAVDIAIDEIMCKNEQPFPPRSILDYSIIIQLWDWLTSKRVTMNDPLVKNISELSEIITKQALLSTLYQLLPFLTRLPTPFRWEIERAQQIKTEIIPPEYQAHIESYTPGIIRDLTDSFISSYEREIAKETKKDIGSMEDIQGLMLDVVVAGSDTISTSLTWFLLYMVLNPNIQEKIQKEIDFVVRGDRLPCWKDAEKMPFLQATLCEVQRASGMVAIVGSNAIRDTTIAGYHIPMGAFVVLNLSQVHHDEREWPEPDQFNPERFLDSDGKFVGWANLHGFLPFAAGRRECPGKSLAKIMMFTFASMLLNHFTFELPKGAEIVTAEAAAAGLVRRPKKFKIVAKQRIALRN